MARAEDLLEANQGNRDSWMPLVPMFDTNYNRLDDNNFVAIVGFNCAGEVVTANAARLYDWRCHDLVFAAHTLSLMYDNPKRARPGEYCNMPIPAAHQITGRVAFTGAAWVRDDHRGLGLGNLLPFTVKLLSRTRWDPDVTFGLMHTEIFRSGFAPRFGFENARAGVYWGGGVHGDAAMALAWCRNDHIIAHAERLLADSAPVLRVTRDRRRDQKILVTG